MQPDKEELMRVLWKTLWAAAALCLLAALVSIKDGVPLFGLSISFWYWNALVLGVLSIPVRLNCTKPTKGSRK